MRRKGLGKRILAITLAALMVGSVADYPGILEVRAEETSTATSDSEEASKPETEEKTTEEKTFEEKTEVKSDEKAEGDLKKSDNLQKEDTEEKIKVAEVSVQTETEEIDPELLEDLPDEKELFNEYIWSILYGDSEIATYGTTAYDHLTGNDKLVYDALKKQIQSVAEGTTSSTEFTVTLKDLGIENNSFTAADLGVSQVSEVNGYYIYLTSEANQKMTAMTKFDFSAVKNALLYDCPYDLYWYDKTQGSTYSLFAPAVRTDGTAYFYYDSITISFAVAKEYKGNADYTVNTDKVNAAKTAAATAKSIVEKYKDKSDYQRLKAYKDEICALVSYNDAAAKDSYLTENGYGDPWQLIYVFDGDSSTNVVCEGYSKAFQYLCDLDGGLTCYTVTGTLGGGTGAGAHMWNLVTLNDANYLVDVTNCDGTQGADSNTIGFPDNLFLAGAGTQTAGESYTISFTAWTNANASVSYAYDTTTIGSYSKDELTIADSKYVEKETTPITEATVSISGDTNTTYDGTTHTVSVTKDGAELTEDTDYTVTIRKDGTEVSEIRDAGSYVITVTGIDNYSGSVEKSVTILPASLEDFTLSLDGAGSNLTRIYTGEAIKPEVSLSKGDSTTLKQDKDYTVSYSNNAAEGIATVTVTGTGNYTGSSEKKFTIQMGDFDNLSGKLYCNQNEYQDLTKSDVWFSSPVTLTAKVENVSYLVSTVTEGTYADSCRLDGETGTLTQTLYFRNPTTKETYSKAVTLKFDKTSPTGSIQMGARKWEQLLAAITFGRYKVNQNAVTIEGKDQESGIDTITYLISDTRKTANELENTTFTEYSSTSKPSLTENQKQIVYAKITDKAGNVSYLSSDGIILDTTAPRISELSILEDASLQDTAFTFRFKTDEAGTYYYLVQPASEAVPASAEAIITAATESSSTLAGTGETGAVVNGSADVEKTVTGLEPNTSYKVYVVVQDAVYSLDTETKVLTPNTSAPAASSAVTTKKRVPTVTAAPTLSGTYGTAVKDLAVTGGEVKVDDAKLTGSWEVTVAKSGDLTKLLPVGTAETCTLTFTPTDSQYAKASVDVVPTIAKRSVYVVIDKASKTYGEENPSFTCVNGEGAGYESVLDGDSLSIHLSTSATKDSDAGTYDITGTASNPNYDVAFTGGKDAFTIKKAPAPKSAEGTRSYVYLSGSNGKVTVDLAKELNLPEDCGDVTYSLQTEDTAQILDASQTGISNELKQLFYKVKAGEAYIGKEAVLTVTIQMKNYQDTTYQLTLRVTDKKPVQAQDVAVEAGQELTYGEAVGSLKLKGSFTDEEDKAVAGTLSWKEPDTKPAVGTDSAEWIFTPDDAAYESVSGSAKIVIKKATPKVVKLPTPESMTYDPGRTLKDIVLAGIEAENPTTQEKLTITWSWKEKDLVPTVDQQSYELIVTPADTENYQAVTVKVPLNIEKAVPTILTVPTAKGLTYGQKLSESTLSGGAASVDGTFTWTNEEVRPSVKDSNSTEYALNFTPADAVNWASVNAKQKVEVSKKVLSFDGSGLTILTKLEDGSKAADFTGTMKLSGVLDGDDVGFTYTQLKAEFETADAGTDKKVVVTVEGSALTNENYSLPDSNLWYGKGTIEKTAALTGDTDLGDAYRLVISDKDKTEVTQDLAKNEKLNTPEKIVDYLKNLLVERKTDGKTPAKENTNVYDVILLHSTDNVNWTRVTTENFPASGVKVTIPYPENTNAADYRFQAVHMFTANRTDANGNVYRAGDVETPTLTLTKEGISMTLTSLSPIALSWVKVEKSSGSSSGGNSSTSSSSEATVTSAATGDSSQPAVWGGLAILCLLGICITAEEAYRRRKVK